MRDLPPSPDDEPALGPPRERMHTILDRDDLDLRQQVERLLQLGAEDLDIENGYLTRIDPATGDHTIVAVGNPGTGIDRGLQSDLKDTYCRVVVAKGGPLAIADAEDEGWGTDPAYRESGLSCYLGGKVVVGGRLYGTVCFMGAGPRPMSFDEQEEMVLGLVIQGVERAIERQRQGERLSQVQEGLQRQESRLRGIANSIPGGIFQYEACPGGDRSVTFVSDQAESLLGISSASDGFLGRFARRIPAPQRRRFRALVEEATRAGERWDQEVPFDRPDGTRVWIRVVSTPDPEPRVQGGTIVYHGVAIDVTEKKEVEQKVRVQSEAMQVASDGIAILGPDGAYRYVNQAHADMYGYDSPEAFIGETWEMCYSQEQIQRFREAVVPTLAEDGEWRGEVIGRRADGEQFPQELTLTVLDDNTIVGVVRDITDRKQRTRGLREREAALEQASEAVLMTEARKEPPGGPIVYVNEAFEKMTGYSEEEIVGKTPRVLQGPETERDTLDSLRAALEAGEEWEGETVNYRKDGTPYVVHWSVTPVRDGQGQLQRWVSVQRDVTEKRRREQELREARKEAEQASRLKSAMLKNMSHELRTPLTSIIGFAEAIGTDVRDAEENGSTDGGGVEAGTIRQFAERIEKSGRRLMNTLASAVKLSRLQSGEAGLAVRSLNVAEPIREALDRVRPQVEEGELELETDYPEQPLWGCADEEGLTIALENLLGNAVKFTEPGGTVTLRAYPEGEVAVLVVEDTGIGMHPEEVERVLQAFEQESQGIDREYEGSGLSLTVARTLIDQMGGTMTVDTEKGVGSRFMIRLPRTEEAPARSEWNSSG